MKQWSPTLSSNDAGAAIVQWHETTDAGRLEHYISFRPHLETEGFAYLPPTLLARLVCHAIISKIPDKGLPELCESLGHMIEFYGARQPTVPRVISHQPLTARFVGNEIRPAFFLEGEED